jgi:hypothetical protein
MTNTRLRYAVYVHDPEGDMGYGIVVGPFYDDNRAEAKARSILRRDPDLECIVLPLCPSSESARAIASDVGRKDLRL